MQIPVVLNRIVDDTSNEVLKNQYKSHHLQL